MIIRILASVAGLFLSSVVVFMATIIWHTLGGIKPPVEVINGGAYAFVTGGHTSVVYQRQIKAHGDAHIEFERIVRCVLPNQAEYVFDIPTVRLQLKSGETRNASRVTELPMALPLDTVCDLNTVLMWSPPFSMNNQSHRVDSMRFFVNAPPENPGESP